MKVRLLTSICLGVALALLLTISIAAQDQTAGNDAPAAAAFYPAYLPLIMHDHVAACSRPPQPISPAHGAALSTLIPSVQFVTFHPADARFHDIHIDTASHFPDPYRISLGAYNHPTKTVQVMENLMPATAYYWRVRDACTDRDSPWSTTFRFTTGSDGTILPPPQLTSPISGTTGLNTPVELQWQPVAGADHYSVHIRFAGQGGGWIFTSPTTSANWSHMQPNTAYDWTVQAMNDYAYGEESELWRFTTGDFQ